MVEAPFNPSKVLCKMVCVKLEQSHGSKGGTFRLSPVMGTSLENRTFWDASPSGEFWISTGNPDAFKYFGLGDEFRISIEKVPEVERLQAELEYKQAELTALETTGKTLNGWAPDSRYAESQKEDLRKAIASLQDRIRDLKARQVD